MSKRKRFIITSGLLSLGFLGVQILDENFRFAAIGGLVALTLLLFVWCLRSGLGFNMSLLSLVLPVLFTLGVGLFWFLLPTNVFTRIPVLFFYCFGIYALCLTTNIYTVSAIRTIALLRAARGVGFVLTLVTAFLLFDAIISLKVSIFLTTLLAWITSIPLFAQGFWVIPLEKKFSKKLMILSLVGSLILAEIATSLYFWPVTIVVGSLFLTVSMYVILGLGQAQLEARLFKTTIREYLLVGILVFVGMFFATRWGGY